MVIGARSLVAHVQQFGRSGIFKKLCQEALQLPDPKGPSAQIQSIFPKP